MIKFVVNFVNEIGCCESLFILLITIDFKISQKEVSLYWIKFYFIFMRCLWNQFIFIILHALGVFSESLVKLQSYCKLVIASIQSELKY